MNPPVATVVLEETFLRCRAEHPAAPMIPRFRGRMHGAVIIRLPILVVPTGRLLRREEERAEGTIAAWCQKCGVYTEYRIQEAEGYCGCVGFECNV